MDAVPDFPSDDAVIVTVPGVFAVASPVAGSTVSTAEFELVHATVRESVVPSLSLTVAVSCRVVMTAIGDRSPLIVTVSTFGWSITEYVPPRVMPPETVFAVRLAVLPVTTRHAPLITSKSCSPPSGLSPGTRAGLYLIVIVTGCANVSCGGPKSNAVPGSSRGFAGGFAAGTTVMLDV